MIHDISHCNNEKCSKKKTCYRYLAHLEALERKLDYLCYLIHENEENGCSAYWNVFNLKECKNKK